MVISGFENAVVGMNEGETKTASLPPEEAYGPSSEDRIIVFKRSEVPPNIDPQAGMQIKLQSPDGSPYECHYYGRYRRQRYTRCKPSSGR